MTSHEARLIELKQRISEADADSIDWALSEAAYAPVAFVHWLSSECGLHDAHIGLLILAKEYALKESAIRRDYTK